MTAPAYAPPADPWAGQPLFVEPRGLHLMNAPEPPRPAAPEYVRSFQAPKRRRRAWPWVLLVVGIIALVTACGGALSAIGNGMTDAAVPTTVDIGTPEPRPVAPSGAPIISGDDVVHVGEDVPAGTYRTRTVVDNQLCYWSRSHDAEGKRLIDNKLPTGGRPQVTLKKGQWFTSQGCPDWIKK